MERQDRKRAWDYIEGIPAINREKSSLKKVREFLTLLGNPDRNFSVIHVAGTNGKGSVCAMLTSCLCEAGISTGTFVSPHLVDIRERFLINGVMATEREFESAFETVFRAVCQWTEKGNLHPTYFEFLFYMAMVIFQNAGVRVLVLETGMGGRSDVTNVIEEPLVSVITSISIDHTAFLGSTVSEIAAHKAGIIKPESPVVYDGTCREAAQIFSETAERLGCTGAVVENVPFLYKNGKIYITVSYCGEENIFEIPFAAPYQARNAALAVQALESSGLGLSADLVRAGLKKTRWQARMEEIRPRVFLDGAHNEDGIREFLKAASMIRSHDTKQGKTWLIFAVASDKEYREMLSEIHESLRPEYCLLAAMDSYRALSMDELFQTAGEIFHGETKIFVLPSVKEAVKELFSEKKEEDIAFIAGSLYLAGEVKEALEEEKHD